MPIMTSPEYLWWAHTWHMQTPLETLGAGSFVAFELKEKVEPDGVVMPGEGQIDRCGGWSTALIAI